MKFSDFRNGDAIDLLADLLDPIANIASDMEFRKLVMAKNRDRARIAQYLLRNHKNDVMEVLARMNGQTVAEYDANAVQMLTQVMAILNDAEFAQFFQSQGLMNADGSFGSAMANTEETGKA